MKTRKSRNDIKQEVIEIIKKSNSQKDLIKNIESYLLKISGKELIKKIEIENIISSALLLHNEKIFENPKIKKLLNVDRVLNFRKYVRNTENLKNKLTIQDILITCKRFKSLIIKNRDKDIHFFVNNDKTLLKFFKFLNKNNDVGDLLREFIKEFKEIIIVDKIKQKKLPISSVSLLFNNNFDIKENTILIYEKFQKKIPQNDIQQILLKWVNKKKGGKNLSPKK